MEDKNRNHTKSPEKNEQDFETAINPNPRANENLDVGTQEPVDEEDPRANRPGSEITDGEAG